MHWWCLVGRHQDLLHFDARRVFLGCVECGRETRGWTLDFPAPRPRFAGVTSRIDCRDRNTTAGPYDEQPFLVHRPGTAPARTPYDRGRPRELWERWTKTATKCA